MGDDDHVEAKRQRLADITPKPPSYVYVSCIDDTDRLIEVDTRILEPFDCRLYKLILYNMPNKCPRTGHFYWRSGMTKGMLTTLTRSLQHGQLSLSRGTTLEEALNTFEYEGVSMGVPNHRMCEVSMIKLPRQGIGFQKRSESVSSVVLRTCEQIAHAIVTWPRLETALETSLHGGPPICTSTASRVWVRFCSKPRLYAEKGDVEASLARKWQPWCAQTLVAIGILHYRLAATKEIDSKARNQASFDALANAVFKDALGGFFGSAMDVPRQSQDSSMRREILHGERFANEMRHTAIDSGVSTTGPVSSKEAPAPAIPKETGQFARACLGLAETILHNATSPATIFSGQCSDDHGKTMERKQLATSLSQRGVKIVRWADEDKFSVRPLVFPPAWSLETDTGGHVGSVHATMLLDFSSMR